MPPRKGKGAGVPPLHLSPGPSPPGHSGTAGGPGHGGSSVSGDHHHHHLHHSQGGDHLSAHGGASGVADRSSPPLHVYLVAASVVAAYLLSLFSALPSLGSQGSQGSQGFMQGGQGTEGAVNIEGGGVGTGGSVGHGGGGGPHGGGGGAVTPPMPPADPLSWHAAPPVIMSGVLVGSAHRGHRTATNAFLYDPSLAVPVRDAQDDLMQEEGPGARGGLADPIADDVALAFGGASVLAGFKSTVSRAFSAGAPASVEDGIVFRQPYVGSHGGGGLAGDPGEIAETARILQEAIRQQQAHQAQHRRERAGSHASMGSPGPILTPKNAPVQHIQHIAAGAQIPGSPHFAQHPIKLVTLFIPCAMGSARARAARTKAAGRQPHSRTGLANNNKNQHSGALGDDTGTGASADVSGDGVVGNDIASGETGGGAGDTAGMGDGTRGSGGSGKRREQTAGAPRSDFSRAAAPLAINARLVFLVDGRGNLWEDCYADADGWSMSTHGRPSQAARLSGPMQQVNGTSVLSAASDGSVYQRRWDFGAWRWDWVEIGKPPHADPGYPGEGSGSGNAGDAGGGGGDGGDAAGGDAGGDGDGDPGGDPTADKGASDSSVVGLSPVWGGRFTYVQTRDGRLFRLRFGEPHIGASPEDALDEDGAPTDVDGVAVSADAPHLPTNNDGGGAAVGDASLSSSSSSSSSSSPAAAGVGPVDESDPDASTSTTTTASPHYARALNDEPLHDPDDTDYGNPDDADPPKRRAADAARGAAAAAAIDGIDVGDRNDDDIDDDDDDDDDVDGVVDRSRAVPSRRRSGDTTATGATGSLASGSRGARGGGPSVVSTTSAFAGSGLAGSGPRWMWEGPIEPPHVYTLGKRGEWSSHGRVRCILSSTAEWGTALALLPGNTLAVLRGHEWTVLPSPPKGATLTCREVESLEMGSGGFSRSVFMTTTRGRLVELHWDGVHYHWFDHGSPVEAPDGRGSIVTGVGGGLGSRSVFVGTADGKVMERYYVEDHDWSVPYVDRQPFWMWLSHGHPTRGKSSSSSSSGGSGVSSSSTSSSSSSSSSSTGKSGGKHGGSPSSTSSDASSHRSNGGGTKSPSSTDATSSTSTSTSSGPPIGTPGGVINNRSVFVVLADGTVHERYMTNEGKGTNKGAKGWTWLPHNPGAQ